MTPAALIPLHTQTLINEFVIGRRRALGICRTHTGPLNELSAHTVASLSALGHSPEAPGGPPREVSDSPGVPIVPAAGTHDFNRTVTSTAAPVSLMKSKEHRICSTLLPGWKGDVFLYTLQQALNPGGAPSGPRLAPLSRVLPLSFADSQQEMRASGGHWRGRREAESQGGARAHPGADVEVKESNDNI